MRLCDRNSATEKILAKVAAELTAQNKKPALSVRGEKRSEAMNDREILHIFVEIAKGRGRHGGFLLAFSEAVMRADPSNFALVHPIALLLISKYGLEKYLDNYEVENQGGAMSEHTPGPWTGPSNTIDQLHWARVGRPAHADWVTIKWAELNKSCVRDANARLIAAAPELLEAMGKLLFAVEETDELGTGYIRNSDAYRESKAAIRKAKGEL